MGDNVIRVAPDSTGSRLRTRSRTVNSVVVHEQYVLPASERVVTAHALISSPRIPVRAATTQPLFVVWNGSSNSVAVRRLVAEVDTIVAKAVLSPWLRTYRITAAPSGGNAVVKGQQDTAETMSSTIVATADASADGTVSSTALTATANPTTAMWQQVLPRLHTAVGFLAVPSLSLLPDDGSLASEAPLILRSNQGVLVRMEVAAAPTAGDWQIGLKAVVDEFTLP